MQVVRDKKKFKDTKVGEWLKTKAPKVLDAVGDLLPDEGLTGIVKRLISNDPDIPAEDKLEFQKVMHQHEREMAAIEVQEMANARAREIDFMKATGHIDYLQTIIGVVILISFIAMQLVVAFHVVPDENRDSFTHMMAIIDVATGMLLNYYFGSSRGSKEKTRMLGGK